MSGTLRVTVDTDAVSAAETIAVAARSVPFMVISDRLFVELVEELGGEQEATRHLIRVATNTGRPIGVNVEDDDGESTTACIAPEGWTRERLAGWIGGKRDELEALFGEASLRKNL